MIEKEKVMRVKVDFGECILEQSEQLYPGAAGARELAHRAPGAIILGGGCEFVLEFLKTHLEA